MPAPVTFKSYEQDDVSGHVFATQEISVGGVTMHIPGGQELFGQPDFGDGGGALSGPTIPYSLGAATTGDISYEKNLAEGCSRLLVKAECSVNAIEVKLRVWWQDSSSTTKAWFPGVMANGEDYLWLRPTGIATNSANLPGYLGSGYHLTSAFVPVQGQKFKIEVVDDGGSSNAVSVWAEGV